MERQWFDVAVIGGGQAGLAMSYHLTQLGRAHVVFEQARIADSWRTRRWDSLRLIAPNWSLRLPGFAYAGDDPEGFMTKDEVADNLVVYARSFDAPVREGVRVIAVKRAPGGGFLVRTRDGDYEAAHVVVATGALQQPRIPACSADIPPSVAQLVPYSYRNPGALPPGAVLIAGSGQSGCQIAEELHRSGRTVYLSVSRSWGVPRRYRGQDIACWARLVGMFDETVESLPPGVRNRPPNPQMSGGDGGHDLTLHTLAREGVCRLGRLVGVRDGTARFAPDLAANLAWGDAEAQHLLRSIDALILRDGLDAPPEDPPACLDPAPHSARETETELNLADAEIGTVIWATGFRPDFAWVRLPVLDEEEYPVHRRGVTQEPGLYFLGLDWLYKRSSGFFAGVGDDASHLSSIIAGAAPAGVGSS